MKPEDVTEKIKVEQMNIIKQEINENISKFINLYMWTENTQLKRWEEAYNFEGKYSTYYRSKKINEILEFAAPQIDDFEYNMTDIQKDYIKKIFYKIESVLKAHNCTLERFNY